MINLICDSGFKRAYQKKITQDEALKKRFWKALELFLENPYEQQLRTHKLTGKLKGLWAFSVAYDCRVIFRFTDNSTVLLIDIGKHDEVY